MKLVLLLIALVIVILIVALAAWWLKSKSDATESSPQMTDVNFTDTNSPTEGMSFGISPKPKNNNSNPTHEPLKSKARTAERVTMAEMRDRFSGSKTVKQNFNPDENSGVESDHKMGPENTWQEYVKNEAIDPDIVQNHTDFVTSKFGFSRVANTPDYQIETDFIPWSGIRRPKHVETNRTDPQQRIDVDEDIYRGYTRHVVG